MPIIYISPSTQEYNPYITGSGSEEYWMNRIVDAMEPYLRSNGIRYRRNDPDTSAGAAIREANSGYYDFYLALHSNAIGNGSAQTSARGIIAFYYPGSAGGQRGAELIAKNLREIYPLPDKVTTRPTTALGEVSRSRFPAVLVEIGYHDNYADATWVEGHMDAIAQQLARALTEYFGLPFIYPQLVRTGVVTTEGSALRLRSYPGIDGETVGSIPNGESVQVYGSFQGWYSVGYDGQLGYAAQAYIAV